MRKTDERRPGGMARAVGATAGIAAVLVRLTAGIAAVACAGYFVQELLKARVKKKKNAFACPPARPRDLRQTGGNPPEERMARDGW